MNPPLRRKPFPWLLTFLVVISAPLANAAGIPPFDGNRAFEDLKALAGFGPRPPGSKTLGEARAYITRELRKTGCQVEEDRFTASTPFGNVEMTNVIAKIPGELPAVVMLSGHYDTLLKEDQRFVGANDGGSSAAFLLEMARLLGRRKNPVTYWLVFFDGEEAFRYWSDTDSRYGSRHLVQQLSQEGQLGRIGAMILVDMIADSQLNIYTEYNSTPWLTDLVFGNAKRLGYSRYFLQGPRAIEDDHIPFVNAGVAAIDLIDLEYGPKTASHPNGSYWHTSEDTVAHCSPQSLNIVGRVVTTSLEELERSPHLR